MRVRWFKWVVLAALILFSPVPAVAVTFFATGQLLIENGPGTHDDVRENYIFLVDAATGVATPYSPVLAGTPAALVGGAGEQLYGYSAGQLGALDAASGVVTPIGGVSGLAATGFEIFNGVGYLLTFTDDTLHRVDLSSGATEQIGGPLVLPGVEDPFIIGLGEVGGLLYGVNLASGATNLVSIDPLTAAATQIGMPNAVAKDGYSGFAAMTGVDEDGDGVYDALFGNANFLNGARIGGIVRYDLVSGDWSLVGTNPGVIFFGFGQPIPEPSTVALLGAGLAAIGRRRRRTAGRVQSGADDLSVGDGRTSGNGLSGEGQTAQVYGGRA